MPQLALTMPNKNLFTKKKQYIFVEQIFRNFILMVKLPIIANLWAYASPIPGQTVCQPPSVSRRKLRDCSCKIKGAQTGRT